MHNAVSWFDLRLAQNKELEFWQTINHAIILYDSMPADCLVKVVESYNPAVKDGQDLVRARRESQ